ncbi:MAG: adenosylcobinamide-GDP ribazoletransferase [Hyphomicrobium sp.]|nr:adenosylcobinamide-GDP ribazoletransferase [Hyphomicrobium sp.]
MITRELQNILAGVQFLTRIPVPGVVHYEPDWLSSAAKYFPLIGAAVGAIAAAVVVTASLVLPQPIPMVMAIVAAIALTGALHEDGLADTADGLFGGMTRERRLEIMKDSRIGTFGVIAVISVLALKISALQALDAVMAAYTLVAAHAGGRFAAVLAMGSLRYSGIEDAAKVTPPAHRIAASQVAIAAVFAVTIGLICLPISTFVISFVVGLAASACLGIAAKRRIGGYTGDVLGGIEQVFEAGFMVTAAALIAGPG